MLRILAMIGDAQASSHVRTALTGYADLVFARDRGELVRGACTSRNQTSSCSGFVRPPMRPSA